MVTKNEVIGLMLENAGVDPVRILGEESAPLEEAFKVGPNCKKVIAAFLDKKEMDGKNLSTDGKRLDGNWMGGRGIAKWEGGKIKFADLGSKAAQTVERAVRKEAPKNWRGEDKDFWDDAEVIASYSRAQALKDGELAEGSGKLDSNYALKFLKEIKGELIPEMVADLKAGKNKESLQGLQDILGSLASVLYAYRGVARTAPAGGAVLIAKKAVSDIEKSL